MARSKRLSFIDKVWSVMKRRVRRRRPHTVPQTETFEKKKEKKAKKRKIYKNALKEKPAVKLTSVNA